MRILFIFGVLIFIPSVLTAAKISVQLPDGQVVNLEAHPVPGDDSLRFVNVPSGSGATRPYYFSNEDWDAVTKQVREVGGKDLFYVGRSPLKLSGGGGSPSRYKGNVLSINPQTGGTQIDTLMEIQEGISSRGPGSALPVKVVPLSSVKPFAFDGEHKNYGFVKDGQLWAIVPVSQGTINGAPFVRFLDPKIAHQLRTGTRHWGDPIPYHEMDLSDLRELDVHTYAQALTNASRGEFPEIGTPRSDELNRRIVQGGRIDFEGWSQKPIGGPRAGAYHDILASQQEFKIQNVRPLPRLCKDNLGKLPEDVRKLND